MITISIESIMTSLLLKDMLMIRMILTIIDGDDNNKDHNIDDHRQ